MKGMNSLIGALLVAGLAGPSFAQGVDLVLPSETDFFANRGLIRLIDLDADGKFDSCGEFVVDFAPIASPCAIGATGGSCSNIRDVAFRSVGGVPTVYWIQNDTDLVWRAVDANGNGRIEASERNIFFSFPGAFPGFSGFVGNCAVDSTGALWVTTNSSSAPNQGIYRLKDLNSDGAAALGVVIVGEPEVSGYLTGPFTVADAAGTGTVALTATDFRAIMVDSADRVIAFLASSGGAPAGVYVAMKDQGPPFNYVWDPGEASNFLYAPNPGESCVAGLKQNPDPGVLFPLIYSWGMSSPCAPGGFGNALRITHASLSAAGQDLYWFGSVSGTGFSAFKGIVLKGRDLSGPPNQDLNDAGEVILFYNGSTQAGPWGPGATPLVDGPNIYQVTIIEDMGAVGETVYMWNDDGPPAIDNKERLGFGAKMDTVWKLADGNGDGDANDAGEQARVATFAPGEFWGPKGKIVAVPPGAFAVPASRRITAGGCPAPLAPLGSDDALVIPQIWTIGNPSVPNPSFAITVKESPTSGGGTIPGGGLGFLVVGVGALNLDLSLLFPASVGCTLVPTINILVLIPLSPSAAPFTWVFPPGTNHSVNASEATLPAPIPADTSILGGCLGAQWAIVGLDPASFAPNPWLSTAMAVRFGP